MGTLELFANWLWLLSGVLGILFLFFGLAGAAILLISREYALAKRLAFIVTTIGAATIASFGISFGYNYSLTREGISVEITVLLASVSSVLLLFGYIRAFKIFVEKGSKP
ncbi:hypothetical protein HUU62_04755 [Rhodoferax sp. 4810]|nr:hypothetical protein [Rhodoferax jenense]